MSNTVTRLYLFNFNCNTHTHTHTHTHTTTTTPHPPPFPDFYQGTISLVLGPRSNIRLPKSSKVFFYFSLIILNIIFRNIIILV